MFWKSVVRDSTAGQLSPGHASLLTQEIARVDLGESGRESGPLTEALCDVGLGLALCPDKQERRQNRQRGPRCQQALLRRKQAHRHLSAAQDILQGQPAPREDSDRRKDARHEHATDVSPEDWIAARKELLVREKELTRARDALAAERRRMPRMAVDKEYSFDGPDGPVSLVGLFEGRRQLIVYRAFYGPDVTTCARGTSYPERACLGCSMVADQVCLLLT